ncbi:hypothetical protein B0H21DRAFT_812254, partial [Amylocystis lapponica]
MALPLTVDPNSLVQPDYTLPDFEAIKQPLVDHGFTEEQAVALLNTLWTVTNNRDKVAWQAQLDAAAAADEQRAQDLLAAEQHRALEAMQEAERARKDENRDKYLPIPMRPTPQAGLVLAAPYAWRRLEKALFLELYYYTNVGLDAAFRAVSGTNDELMSMQHNEDGSVSWIPAKTVIEDQDLTWGQIMEAVPRFISAMKQARWDAPRVSILARFWDALQMHPLKQSRDPLGTRAIIVYQAEQRKRWHLAITAPGGAWDLSILDEEAMRETRDRVYHLDRARRDDARTKEFEALARIRAPQPA